jgi:multidrug efflux pump subunit AcrB
MKHFNLSAWAVSHPALILFLVVALGAAGFFSYERLGRAEDPFFTVKVVNVSAIWPGATAAEMQTQVADPIEKKLQELPYFEKVQTYSKPAFTAMQVTFRDSTPAKDVPFLFYLLRKKLVDVQAQLPANLLGPVVNDEFSDVDSILYTMTSDGADYAQLKKAAEGMRQRLLRVPGVTKVDFYGTQDERIYVEFSHAKLATLGITPQALFDSLAKQNNVVPAGTVETSSQRRQGGGGDAGRKQRPGVSARRYRYRHPRFRRSAHLHGAPGRQARARHRRGHHQGRQHSGPWQGCCHRHRGIHEGGAAGHQCRPDRRSAQGGRACRQ